MSSYRQHLFHIVFRTKHNLDTIKQDHVNELYAYITGIIKQKNCHLYRINGIVNHVHILTDIHPSIASADLTRDIKASSSFCMKNTNLFPSFTGWEEGYVSFTCSYRDLNMLIEYIKNQQVHHKTMTFEDEYRQLLSEAGITPDERYFP